MTDLINQIVGDRRILAGKDGTVPLFIITCCVCFWLILTDDEPDVVKAAGGFLIGGEDVAFKSI